MLVLHRVGDSLVAEPVFKVVFNQKSDGGIGIRVEVESEGEVGDDTVIAFMSEDGAAEMFNQAVDPLVVLNMMVDVAGRPGKANVDLRAEAANLGRELGEVVLQLKKYFHMEE